MNYFVMACYGVYPSAAFDKGPEMNDAPWMSGKPVRLSLPEPLKYVLDAKRPGNIPAMADDMSRPLMHDDLVAALQAAGVDNLQLFSATVEDPVTGIIQTNFKTFNVLGLVSKANAVKLPSDADPVEVEAYKNLPRVDAEKAKVLNLFRLAEDVSAIVVTEALKAEVEKRDIPGMVFIPLADHESL